MPSNCQTKLHGFADRVARSAVNRGLDPLLFGYRYIRKESLRGYLERTGNRDGEIVRVVHEPDVARNHLPQNITHRDQLPKDRGWWGYSFWDVPERESGETLVAKIRDCRVIPSENSVGEFWATIETKDKTSLELREISFRSWQAKYFRNRKARRVAHAVWVTERVFDNYSHWFTAHLPKLLMLREEGLDADVILPSKLPPAVEESLRMYGMPPEKYRSFDPRESLQFDELTVVVTDRFHPALLKLVPQHCPVDPAAVPKRRVFISRELATRRRLLNENELWPILKGAGFEKVLMEELSFREQVQLMRETGVLLAPHGAGLTNMMFCPEGATVVELADLSFPNPNFYAVAAAMGHRYCLIEGESTGDCHPLEKDLWVAPGKVAAVITALQLDS